MIIIEGANGTGKSTLSKRLMYALQLRYHKENLTRESVKKLSFEQYVHDSNLLDQDLLLDRFHLGQYVYPHVYKDGRTPLALEEQHTVERILMNRGAVLVYCEASKDFIKNVYDTRGEDMQTWDDVSEELIRFNEAFDRSIMIKFKFNPEWPIEKQKATIQNIIETYKMLQLRASNLKRFKGCGTITGKPIMLVGEQFNWRGLYHKHAFGWYSGSSNFLHKALSLTTNPANYYLTNAIKSINEQKNIDMLHEEFTLLEPYRVIALGRKASYILKQALILHEYIPHPQFIKRFKYSQIDNYAEIIDKLSIVKEDKC